MIGWCFFTGLIRCLTVSPDSRWIAVGYSSGVISTLDVRTGLLMASWKGHEGEVLQVHIVHNSAGAVHYYYSTAITFKPIL